MIVNVQFLRNKSSKGKGKKCMKAVHSFHNSTSSSFQPFQSLSTWLHDNQESPSFANSDLAIGSQNSWGTPANQATARKTIPKVSPNISLIQLEEPQLIQTNKMITFKTDFFFQSVTKLEPQGFNFLSTLSIKENKINLKKWSCLLATHRMNNRTKRIDKNIN